MQLENWKCRDQPSCCTCIITATVSVFLPVSVIYFYVYPYIYIYSHDEQPKKNLPRLSRVHWVIEDHASTKTLNTPKHQKNSQINHVTRFPYVFVLFNLPSRFSGAVFRCAPVLEYIDHNLVSLQSISIAF